MDAREKWIEAAEKLAEQMVLLDSCSAMSVGNGDNKYEEEFIDKRAQLFAHLRTTPEGFALVPDKPTCWMYTGKVTGTKSFSTVQHDKDSSPPEYFDETPLYAAPPPKSEPL